MNLSRIVAVGILASGLSACGIGVQSFLDQELTGTDFNGHLARKYQERTAKEVNVDMEWTHAGRLAAKGKAAARGEAVSPWVAANWNVLPEDMGDLDAARARLMAALDSGGRQSNPEACACAQVYYDGWLEQANDNDYGVVGYGPVQPDYVAAERAAFEEIMPECEGGAAKSFIIYFGFDRADLTDAAVAVVDEISSYVASGRTVSVVGHTDTSGDRAYNTGLSQRRANIVAGALTQRNVSLGTVTWQGEGNTAVPTADGVREPLNRRATIILN